MYHRHVFLTSLMQKNNNNNKNSYSLYTGVLKCLCGPEGALNKLPVLTSKHPFLSYLLLFLFLFSPPFGVCFFLPHMSSKGLFKSVEDDWK